MVMNMLSSFIGHHTLKPEDTIGGKDGCSQGFDQIVEAASQELYAVLGDRTGDASQGAFAHARGLWGVLMPSRGNPCPATHLVTGTHG
jgi:hypothetical protein